MPFFLIPAAISATSWMLGTAAATTVAAGTYAYARSRNESEKRRAYESGRNEARAEYDLQLEQFKQQVQELREKDSRYYNVVVAVVRVAYSTANELGCLNRRTRRDIDELLIGALWHQLPESTIRKIDEAYRQPVPLREAVRSAGKYVSPEFLIQLESTVQELAN